MSCAREVLDCVKNATLSDFREVKDEFPQVSLAEVEACNPYTTLKQVMSVFRSGLTRKLQAAVVQDRGKEKYLFRMQVHARGSGHPSHNVRVLWYSGKVDVT